jgi:hypothetical protein
VSISVTESLELFRNSAVEKLSLTRVTVKATITSAISAHGCAVINAYRNCIVEAFDQTTVYAYVNSVVYCHGDSVKAHESSYGVPGSKKPNYPPRVNWCRDRPTNKYPISATPTPPIKWIQRYSVNHIPASAHQPQTHRMINSATPNMILIDRQTDTIIRIQKIKINKAKPCRL